MDDHILDYWGPIDQDAHLVVADFFDFESEARLAAARLREEGIASVVTHSLIATTLPLGNGAIRLQVLEKDLSAACRVLAEMDRQRGVEPAQLYQDPDEEDISFLRDLYAGQRKSTFFWLLAVLFLIVFLFLRLLYGSSDLMPI